MALTRGAGRGRRRDEREEDGGRERRVRRERRTEGEITEGNDKAVWKDGRITRGRFPDLGIRRGHPRGGRGVEGDGGKRGGWGQGEKG